MAAIVHSYQYCQFEFAFSGSASTYFNMKIKSIEDCRKKYHGNGLEGKSIAVSIGYRIAWYTTRPAVQPYRR